jgi:hypothetical protein
MLEPTREQRRQLERDNRAQTKDLSLVPPENWPASYRPDDLIQVWRSQDFLVQVFQVMPPDPVMARVSVCRTMLLGSRWQDNISWDDLQKIKGHIGFGNFDAVEVYPPDKDAVNVANMRHLWIMYRPLAFAWRKA